MDISLTPVDNKKPLVNQCEVTLLSLVFIYQENLSVPDFVTDESGKEEAFLFLRFISDHPRLSGMSTIYGLHYYFPFYCRHLCFRSVGPQS